MGKVISVIFDDEKTPTRPSSYWDYLSPCRLYSEWDHLPQHDPHLFEDDILLFEDDKWYSLPPEPVPYVAAPVAQFVTPSCNGYLAPRPATVIKSSQYKSVQVVSSLCQNKKQPRQAPVEAPSSVLKPSLFVQPMSRKSSSSCVVNNANAPVKVVPSGLISASIVATSCLDDVLQKPIEYITPFEGVNPSSAKANVAPSTLQSAPVVTLSSTVNPLVVQPKLNKNKNISSVVPVLSSSVAKPSSVITPVSQKFSSPSVIKNSHDKVKVAPSILQSAPVVASSATDNPSVVQPTKKKKSAVVPVPSSSEVKPSSVIPPESHKCISPSVAKNANDTVKVNEQDGIQFNNTQIIVPLHHIKPKIIYSIDGHNTEGNKLTKFLNEKFSKPIKSVNVIKLPISEEEIFEIGLPFETKNAYVVQCPSIFAAYMLRKKEYDIKNKLTTEEFIHATPTKKVNQILEHNLNYRKNYRYRFGSGVCFTPFFEYAFNCTKKKSKLISFIICEVLIGEMVDRKAKYQRDISIDTGVGKKGVVYVKARDDEFIPLIVFDRSMDSQMNL